MKKNTVHTLFAFLLVSSFSSNAYCQIRWLSPSQMITGSISANWAASLFAYGYSPGITALAAAIQSMQSSQNSSTGNINTPVEVQIVEPSAVPHAMPEAKKIPLDVQLSADDLKRLAENSPSKYPLVKSKIKPSVPPINKENPDLNEVGKYYKFPNGAAGRLKSIQHNPCGCDITGNTTYTSIDGNGNGYVDVYSGGGSAHGCSTPPAGFTSFTERTRYYVDHAATSGDPPGWTPSAADIAAITPKSVSDAISSSGKVNPTYQDEINKMVQDPNYVPVFNDSTGLPWTPPPDSMNPDQIKAAVQDASNYAAQQAQKDAVASAGQAAGSAGQAAEAAKNRYAGSGGDPATGQGGDPGLYGAYLRAKAAADAAKAAADKAAADAAQTGAEDAAGGFITAPDAPGAYGDQTQKFDFGQRFSQFFDAMKSTPIFSIPRSLIPAGLGSGSSVFTANVGRFGNQTFDLANFSSAWIILRSVLLILAGFCSVKIVTLKGDS